MQKDNGQFLPSTKIEINIVEQKLLKKVKGEKPQQFYLGPEQCVLK